ncbi:MAG: toll/interleukin-1 receptor domain-containing protein, partial [Acidiferrobacterales bacterium]
MSDIFISYAREDRDRAQAIAQALEKQGLAVWWDRNILPGGTWDKVIEKALDEAKCVIVLWSNASVQSDFVKEEAEKGKERGILVPVLIDDVELPFGFARYQAANLVHWRGGLTHAEFKELSQSVAQKLGREDKVESETEPAQQTAEEEAQLEIEAARRKAEAERQQAEEEAGQKAEAERQRAEAARVAEAVQPPERPAATPWLLQPERWFSPTIAVLTVVVVVFISAAAYFFIQRNAALQELEALRAGETDATVSDAKLVRDYEKFRETYSVYLYFDSAQADDVKGKIKEFKTSAAAFAKVKQDDKSDSLTVRQRLDRWQDYRPARDVGPEAKEKRTRVAALERVVEQLAELSNREKNTTVSNAEVTELVAAYEEFSNTQGDHLNSAETVRVEHKIVAFKELKDHRAREVDATVSDAKLVRDYQKFLEIHKDHLDSTMAARVADRIKEFKTSAAAFAKLKQDDKSDSLTVRQRLDR